MTDAPAVGASRPVAVRQTEVRRETPSVAALLLLVGIWRDRNAPPPS